MTKSHPPESQRTVSVTDPSDPAAPPAKAADRSPASGTVDDLQTVTKAALGRIPKDKRPKLTQAEQSAEFERVAKEHGAEGDERSFNAALTKMAKPRA